MSEEELKKVKGIVKRLFAGTGVTIGDIVDAAPWLDKLVNEVERLQKELDNSISKDKIRNKIKELEKQYKEELRYGRVVLDIGHTIKILKELLGE